MANPNPNKATRFKKGEGGRKKGSRNKLTQAYLKLLDAALGEHGKEALDKTIDTRPDVFLKLVGQLVPKDLDVRHSGDVTINIVDYSDIAEDDQADKTEDD